MMENRVAEMHILDLNTASPFKDIFPIREGVLKEIVADMKTNGYDPAHPIILWAGHRATVVDGHTRLYAAKEAGLIDIPVVAKDFSDEREALEYAIRSQRHRRNLTDAELLTCLDELDKLGKAGRPGKSASMEANFKGKSATRTAELFGVSRAQVERLRTVKEHAPDEVRDAVSSGRMSVRKAYDETMKNRRTMESDTPEKIAELKNARKKAVPKSIIGMVQSRLEREIQEYPEVGYSDEDRREIAKAVLVEIEQLITDMLPGEHEDE